MAGMLVGMAFVPWRSSLDLRGGMIMRLYNIIYIYILCSKIRGYIMG